MKLRGVLLLVGGVILAVSPWLGCTDVPQIMDPEPEFQILNVAYGDPGVDPNPCDDLLPIVDGVGSPQEWALAEPLFLRMSGQNGTGGPDFFLEIRGLWTDESRRGQGGTDRIYFLVRYYDPELNASPDELAYIHPLQPGEFCRNTLEIEGALYCPSPRPRSSGVTPDSVLVRPSSWTRIYPDGKEDQVLLALAEVPGVSAPSALIDLNRSLLGVIGPPDVPSTWRAPAGVSGVDVWVWRAGRTNLHPINQFPNWSAPYDNDQVPERIYDRFDFKCGFAEDMWVDGGGQLADDAGLVPYVVNFGRKDFQGNDLPGVPLRMAGCPAGGREPSEADLAKLNGGVPKELGLWWPTAVPFKVTDSLVCTRQSAHPPLWGPDGLILGEWDWVPGWGMRTPSTQTGPASARSVRAKGVQEDKQEKGFGVRSVEFMRELDTRESDDLAISPGTDPAVLEYRLVIGVFSNSGRIASGSSEVRLRFEAPKPKIVGGIDRCS
jgi:hypothetical protein